MFLKAVWIAFSITSDIMIFRIFAYSEKNETCELEIIFAFNWNSEFFKVFAQSEKFKRIVDSDELFSDDFSELVRWLDNKDEFSWDVSEQKLNRKLSRLWMSSIIEQVFVEFKNFWIILINSFFVNHSKWAHSHTFFYDCSICKKHSREISNSIIHFNQCFSHC